MTTIDTSKRRQAVINAIKNGDIITGINQGFETSSDKFQEMSENNFDLRQGIERLGYTVSSPKTVGSESKRVSAFSIIGTTDDRDEKRYYISALGKRDKAFDFRSYTIDDKQMDTNVFGKKKLAKNQFESYYNGRIGGYDYSIDHLEEHSNNILEQAKNCSSAKDKSESFDSLHDFSIGVENYVAELNGLVASARSKHSAIPNPFDNLKYIGFDSESFYRLRDQDPLVIEKLDKARILNQINRKILTVSKECEDNNVDIAILKASLALYEKIKDTDNIDDLNDFSDLLEFALHRDAKISRGAQFENSLHTFSNILIGRGYKANDLERVKQDFTNAISRTKRAKVEDAKKELAEEAISNITISTQNLQAIAKDIITDFELSHNLNNGLRISPVITGMKKLVNSMGDSIADVTKSIRASHERVSGDRSKTKPSHLIIGMPGEVAKEMAKTIKRSSINGDGTIVEFESGIIFDENDLSTKKQVALSGDEDSLDKYDIVFIKVADAHLAQRLEEEYTREGGNVDAALAEYVAARVIEADRNKKIQESSLRKQAKVISILSNLLDDDGHYPHRSPGEQTRRFFYNSFGVGYSGKRPLHGKERFIIRRHGEDLIVNGYEIGKGKIFLSVEKGDKNVEIEASPDQAKALMDQLLILVDDKYKESIYEMEKGGSGAKQSQYSKKAEKKLNRQLLNKKWRRVLVQPEFKDVGIPADFDVAVAAAKASRDELTTVLNFSFNLYTAGKTGKYPNIKFKNAELDKAGNVVISREDYDKPEFQEFFKGLNDKYSLLHRDMKGKKNMVIHIDANTVVIRGLEELLISERPQVHDNAFNKKDDRLVRQKRSADTVTSAMAGACFYGQKSARELAKGYTDQDLAIQVCVDPVKNFVLAMTALTPKQRVDFIEKFIDNNRKEFLTDQVLFDFNEFVKEWSYDNLIRDKELSENDLLRFAGKELYDKFQKAKDSGAYQESDLSMMKSELEAVARKNFDQFLVNLRESTTSWLDKTKINVSEDTIEELKESHDLISNASDKAARTLAKDYLEQLVKIQGPAKQMLVLCEGYNKYGDHTTCANVSREYIGVVNFIMDHDSVRNILSNNKATRQDLLDVVGDLLNHFGIRDINLGMRNGVRNINDIINAIAVANPVPPHDPVVVTQYGIQVAAALGTFDVINGFPDKEIKYLKVVLEEARSNVVQVHKAISDKTSFILDEENDPAIDPAIIIDRMNKKRHEIYNAGQNTLDSSSLNKCGVFAQTLVETPVVTNGILDEFYASLDQYKKTLSQNSALSDSEVSAFFDQALSRDVYMSQITFNIDSIKGNYLQYHRDALAEMVNGGFSKLEEKVKAQRSASVPSPLNNEKVAESYTYGKVLENLQEVAQYQVDSISQMFCITQLLQFCQDVIQEDDNIVAIPFGAGLDDLDGTQLGQFKNIIQEIIKINPDLGHKISQLYPYRGNPDNIDSVDGVREFLENFQKLIVMELGENEEKRLNKIVWAARVKSPEVLNSIVANPDVLRTSTAYHDLVAQKIIATGLSNLQIKNLFCNMIDGDDRNLNIRFNDIYHNGLVDPDFDATIEPEKAIEIITKSIETGNIDDAIKAMCDFGYSFNQIQGALNDYSTEIFDRIAAGDINAVIYPDSITISRNLFDFGPVNLEKCCEHIEGSVSQDLGTKSVVSILKMKGDAYKNIDDDEKDIRKRASCKQLADNIGYKEQQCYSIFTSAENPEDDYFKIVVEQDVIEISKREFTLCNEIIKTRASGVYISTIKPTSIAPEKLEIKRAEIQDLIDNKDIPKINKIISELRAIHKNESQFDDLLGRVRNSIAKIEPLDTTGLSEEEIVKLNAVYKIYIKLFSQIADNPEIAAARAIELRNLSNGDNAEVDLLYAKIYATVAEEALKLKVITQKYENSYQQYNDDVKKLSELYNTNLALYRRLGAMHNDCTAINAQIAFVQGEVARINADYFRIAVPTNEQTRAHTAMLKNTEENLKTFNARLESHTKQRDDLIKEYSDSRNTYLVGLRDVTSSHAKLGVSFEEFEGAGFFKTSGASKSDKNEARELFADKWEREMRVKTDKFKSDSENIFNGFDTGGFARIAALPGVPEPIDRINFNNVLMAWTQPIENRIISDVIDANKDSERRSADRPGTKVAVTSILSAQSGILRHPTSVARDVQNDQAATLATKVGGGKGR